MPTVSQSPRPCNGRAADELLAKKTEPAMTEPTYDLVIRGGRVATASDVFDADVGIFGERIASIGSALAPGKRELDARGKLVLPGGIDSHSHIEQLSAAGIM